MARAASALLLLVAMLAAASAFKRGDFKTCSQSAFCSRLRGSDGAKYRVDRTSVVVEGGVLRARLEPEGGTAGGSPGPEDPAPAATLDLELTSYDFGAVRLRLTERGVRRFEVPDVLLEGLEGRRGVWAVERQTAEETTLVVTEGYDGRESSPARLRVSLRYAPAAVTASDPATDRVLLSWNAEGSLHVEGARVEREGDPAGWWAERFNGHEDTKPRGPQGLAFDAAFPSARHLYGLPERAAKFALAPTVRRAREGEGDGAGAQVGAGTPGGAPVSPELVALSEPYRLYNLDVFEHETESPFGLYGSVPLVFAAGPDATVGLLWLNAAEMWVDVESKDGDGGEGTAASPGSPPPPRPAYPSSRWTAESGVLDVFFLPGPTPAEVSAQYARLTGGTALPPAFSLGYHQCRWNYRDERDVAEVAAELDRHRIPFDVIWLDIEHTDGKRYLTWDTKNFPSPREMQERLFSTGGRRTVTIVDPHVKRDPSYSVFREATDLGLFVKDKGARGQGGGASAEGGEGTDGDAKGGDCPRRPPLAPGGDFDGWCWPGSSSYLDVSDDRVRDWWADRFSLENYPSSTCHLHVWNDMNEPSVFNGPEVTMPKDALHRPSGAGDSTGDRPWVEHRDLHNAYGKWYHAATAEGLRRRGERECGGQRPFVLTRAYFAGSQRHGPAWTGDNGATWEHLSGSVRTLLSAGLAGMAHMGADVGGFFGNPSTELLERWYQLGAWYPFFRAHAHLEAARREPYLFGEETASRVREAVEGRYRYLPYIYSTMAAANATGLPALRPLWFEFPGLLADPAGAVEEVAFLVGDSVLVAPVVQPGATEVRVPLPSEALWYDARTGLPARAGSFAPAFPASPALETLTVLASRDRIPTYLRGGRALLTRERPRRSVASSLGDPLTLVVALGPGEPDAALASARPPPASILATGRSYLDDGETQAHVLGGAYSVRLVEAAEETATGDLLVRWRAGGSQPGLPPPDAAYDPGVLVDRLVVLGIEDVASGAWAATVEPTPAARARGPRPPAARLSAGPSALFPGVVDAAPLAALEVRRLRLPAGGEWTVRLSRSGGGAVA